MQDMHHRRSAAERVSHMSEILSALKAPPGEWISLNETRTYQGNIDASNDGRPATANRRQGRAHRAIPVV